ncbi:unnamed protein product [Phytomonas sp. Hart1]|nr:unnamed protein product [Phytomonas sp. Hart1]|eukprot:CCW70369.1 unnamed protein product [Phytomonas sp. isolate Hart1]
MLPAGFPNSTTPDFVAVAWWDAIQTLCSSIMSTLSIRAVLIGVGVGASTANTVSSTASWMLRDGMLVVANIVLSTLWSGRLGSRAKTWRHIADICNNLALLVELCSSWFSRYFFLALVATASILKALVAVTGDGVRQTLIPHFAKKGNAADVDAKSRTFNNMATFLGLLLGNVVAFVTPPTSCESTLRAFFIFSIGFQLASQMTIRSMVFTRLNAPRLEWCLGRFYDHEVGIKRTAKKTDTTLESVPNSVQNGERGSISSCLDISPEVANKKESVYTLPSLTLLPQFMPLCALKQFLYKYLHFLSIKIYFGASLFTILHNNSNLASSIKHCIIKKVGESLSTRGVALLFDESHQTYYVLFSEIHSKDGHPKSWEGFAKQLTLTSLSQKKMESGSASHRDRGASQTSVKLLSTNGVQPEAELEKATQRALWAYFYAYSHTRAMALPRQNGTTMSTQAKEGAPPHNKDAASHAAILGRQDDATLHVIQSLRADGVLDLRRQRCKPRPEFQENAEDKMVKLDQDSDDDHLYPLYLRFISDLQRNGWMMDRLMVPQQGHTIVVQL